MKSERLSKTVRERKVIKTSLLSIVVNFLLTGAKFFIGLASNSIAIISDAVNNMSDAMSNIVTIIGAKLASKDPDKKHPFGHGRAEYLSALLVSIAVLYAGATALIESVRKIIYPESVDYSIYAIIVVTSSVIIKLILGFYVKKKGKKINSDSLMASGVDAICDALLSASILVSILIYLIFRINIEAYVSSFLAIFIIRTGYILTKNSVDNMLGIRVEAKLSTSIRKDIMQVEGVEGMFDLILNNYGPDQYLGSVHIEVMENMSATEIDKISREITSVVSNKYNVKLHTVGINALNKTDKKTQAIKELVEKEALSFKGISEVHGFYLDEKQKILAFDIVVDFSVKERKALYKKVYKRIQKLFPDYDLDITSDIYICD